MVLGVTRLLDGVVEEHVVNMKMARLNSCGCGIKMLKSRVNKGRESVKLRIPAYKHCVRCNVTSCVLSCKFGTTDDIEIASAIGRHTQYCAYELI